MSFLERFSKKKLFKYKISWKQSGWTRVVQCGQMDWQTDRYGEANSWVAFRNFANAPKRTMNAEDGNRMMCYSAHARVFRVSFRVVPGCDVTRNAAIYMRRQQNVRIEGRTVFSRRAWVSCSCVTRGHGSMLAPAYVTLSCVIIGLCGLPTARLCSIAKCLKIWILRKLISEEELRRWHNVWNLK
jgi:hypothetical protein